MSDCRDEVNLQLPSAVYMQSLDAFTFLQDLSFFFLADKKEKEKLTALLPVMPFSRWAVCCPVVPRRRPFLKPVTALFNALPAQ